MIQPATSRLTWRGDEPWATRSSVVPAEIVQVVGRSTDDFESARRAALDVVRHRDVRIERVEVISTSHRSASEGQRFRADLLVRLRPREPVG